MEKETKRFYRYDDATSNALTRKAMTGFAREL